MTGYTYKNSVSNGALFHLGARLARYTDNGTYVAWAERIYDWMDASGRFLPPWSLESLEATLDTKFVETEGRTC